MDFNSNQFPRVGVGIIVCDEDKVLLGQRISSWGDGSWQFAGGHLEFGETVEQCAAREVFEETGVSITNIRRGPYTNDFFVKEGRHYITLFVLADFNGGEATVREPHKCRCWRWFNWNSLPEPLFLPIQNLLKDGTIANYLPQLRAIKAA